MGYFAPLWGRKLSHVFAAATAAFDNSKKRGSAEQRPRARPGAEGENRYERGVRDSAFTATELRTLKAASVPR